MAFKFFLVALIAGAANAGFIASGPSYGAPLAYAAVPAKTVLTKTIDADYDANPQYSYAYDVQDSLTGDFKSQQESRNGDVVQGSYSLIEADGSRRIVDYTADPANGFNAVVRKEPGQIAVKAVAKIATPIAHAKILATPTAYAAPLAYAAPAAPAAYVAPAGPAAYAKIAAPSTAYIRGAGPLSYISHVSYSTPLFSYSH